MTDTSPIVGKVQQVAPGLRRIIAPNPSPMTYWGTNTFVLGETELAIIDPGPKNSDHLKAIIAAVGKADVTCIIVTHSHLDHSPLAKELSEKTGAEVFAFGDSSAGKSELMQRIEAQGLSGGGEGVDRDFAPNRFLTDGAVISSKDWSISALHTPGHMGNHIALHWKDAVFTGDLVMGWASTMVSPPDGDLTDFLNSCQRLKALNAKTFYPAHGDQIDDPKERIDWLVQHRNARTDQILAALQTGPNGISDLTKSIYTDAPPGLRAAAARNVFAHLIDLHQKGMVSAKPELGPDAIYALT